MTSPQPAPRLDESSPRVGTVAIVGGTGALGLGLATRWAHAGIDVRIGSRRADAAQAVATRLPRASGGAIAAMVDGAPVVVLAVLFCAHC